MTCLMVLMIRCLFVGGGVSVTPSPLMPSNDDPNTLDPGDEVLINQWGSCWQVTDRANSPSGSLIGLPGWWARTSMSGDALT